MVQIEAALVCADADVITKFCMKVLGFQVAETRQFQGLGSVTKLRRGEARVKLLAPESPPTPNQAPGEWSTVAGWRYIALRLDEREELDRIASAVTSSGGVLLRPPFSHRPGAAAALAADPDGNVWELIWESNDESNVNGRTV